MANNAQHSKDWLVEGKIPAKSVCPFRVICTSAKEGSCGHSGHEHAVPFSCGTARWYNMDKTFATPGEANADKSH